MKSSLSFSILLVLGSFSLSFAQQAKPEKPVQQPGSAQTVKTGEVQWMGFEEAVKRNEKEPRKILIDVYTKWCGWCKRMDATTYKDPVITDYINRNFYPVKLDAETRDTILFKNNRTQDSTQKQEKRFVYKPEFKANELAVSLLNGKMGYPATIFMDENYSLLTQAIPGYQDAKSLEMILKFYGKEVYKIQKFEDFQKSFQPEVK